MTHPRKEQRQFTVGQKDVAVVGRLGGGHPVPAIDWMQDLYGVGWTGVGRYSGSNMDSTSSQGTNSNDTDSGTSATGDAAGGGAVGANTV
jgi:hypothetical protein